MSMPPLPVPEAYRWTGQDEIYTYEAQFPGRPEDWDMAAALYTADQMHEYANAAIAKDALAASLLELVHLAEHGDADLDEDNWHPALEKAREALGEVYTEDRARKLGAKK